VSAILGPSLVLEWAFGMEFRPHQETQSANELVRLLPGLASLQAESLGDPEVRIAVLDGPVDLSHPCFSGANVIRLNTLISDAATSGPMSSHGTHVSSLIFGQPGTSVCGIAPRCRGLILPVERCPLTSIKLPSTDPNCSGRRQTQSAFKKSDLVEFVRDS
jgi:subtilisin family serine protease